MTSSPDRRQEPIGSGFSASTTAAEVLAGRDLTGTRALVTGGYSGLGTEIVRALTGAGAHVVVPARRPAAAREVLAEVAPAELVTTDELDLADLASVRGFAERLLAGGGHLDVVIDNAGVMACPEERVGPGWERQLATNHLGHFALVNLLWPALTAAPGGARVVSVSSRGHHISGVRWDDPMFSRGYDKWEAYGQSKTANALFALHLDELGRAHGVRAFSLHPGGIMTPLQRHLPQQEMVERGWIDEQGNVIGPGFKTPAQGAATATWAATSPQLDGLGGLYLEDCDVAAVATEAGASGVREYACDPEQAARLWALSAELTGVDAFA